jgi:hypothetical protein
MSGFLYPRVIAVTRPTAAPSAGDAGYLGLQQTSETTIATGIRASIQFDSHGARPVSDVPADSSGRSLWKVFIPLSAGIANGTIQKNDILTDDLGNRYQVEAPYWNSLGWNLRAESLKA